MLIIAFHNLHLLIDVEFGRVVSMLESILMKAEDVSSIATRDAINDVRESLEDALKLMTQMQDSGYITNGIYSESSKILTLHLL